jgi:Skp family chaperone for outer membrane proteins
MLRFILCISFLLISFPAWAGGIATVDFQRALTQIQEGKKIESELNTLMQQKQGEVQQLQMNIQTQMQQYQQQQPLLSDQARAEKEQVLYQMQMEAQQKAYEAEMEFQQVYAQKMEVLINKMRVIAEEIGADKKYDMVFESTESGLIYSNSSIPDITDLVIKQYDARHPG